MEKESLNSMIRREYAYASSVKNYINGDPILDYYHAIKSTVKQDKMSDHMSNMCQRGVNHENRIYHSLKEYSRKYSLSYVDIREYDYDDKYRMTVAALKNRVDILVQPMLVSYSCPAYGVADLIIKRKYMYLVDHKRLPFELSTKCSLDCTETDHGEDYCIVEIKRTVIHVNSEHVILNSNFASFEGQAHVYAVALLDMLEILSIKYSGKCTRLYWPSTYIYVRDIISAYTKIKYCPFIEVQHEKIHMKVMRAIAWLQLVNRYFNLIVPGIHVLPNPDNKYDHPYRTAKLECALYSGDIAYLPGSDIRVRRLLHKRGIYSIYDRRCTPELVLNAVKHINKSAIRPDYSRVISNILKVNQRIAAPYIPRLYLPNGLLLYCNDKDFGVVLDGEYRSKLPYKCHYNVIYYYYDSSAYMPHVPPFYSLKDIRKILEENAVVLPGIINYDKYFVFKALYSAGLISSALTDDIYTDTMLFYELFDLLSNSIY